MNNKLIQLYSALQARLSADREEGATAVEYGLMVALIAAVIIAAVTALGVNVAAQFTTVANAIAGA
jgi:pilus assembly protein Flp/PilA